MKVDLAFGRLKLLRKYPKCYIWILALCDSVRVTYFTCRRSVVVLYLRSNSVLSRADITRPWMRPSHARGFSEITKQRNIINIESYTPHTEEPYMQCSDKGYWHVLWTHSCLEIWVSYISFNITSLWSLSHSLSEFQTVGVMIMCDEILSKYSQIVKHFQLKA